MALNSFRFNYGGDSFRFCQSTLVFWPEARIVLPADEGDRPLLFTTTDQYLRYASSLGCAIKDAPSAAQTKERLQEKGIKSGTLLEAIEYVRRYPDTSLSQRCMNALQEWCLVERSIRSEPKAVADKTTDPSQE
ncbi:MAG: hypothetical protein AAGB19_13775 [Cyanobacteria bacterium P01_F01_bin.3]